MSLRTLLRMFGTSLLAVCLFAAAGSYEDTIRAWQQHRETGLRSPNGWLTLVALYWLKPGDNTVGSAADNNLVLPKSVSAHAGRVRSESEGLTWISSDQKVKPLSYDEDHPDVVQLGSVSFFAIKRGDRLGIRAKDAASPILKSFKGSEFFPINASLHFQARLIPEEKTIPIRNVLGQVEMQKSPGRVEFTYRSKTYSLRPIFEGNTLYFLFKDSTNRSNTYQGGRMLNTPLPTGTSVDLDFNRSYNPPCTFTVYATCPLPPKENTLSFAVEAGEKRYGSGHAEPVTE